MSGDEYAYIVPMAFIGLATDLELRPTGNYQPYPNGDGTQRFVDLQGQPVVLLWQYGKVWLCREIEEEKMPTQEEKDKATAALDIQWGLLQQVKALAQTQVAALTDLTLRIEDELQDLVMAKEAIQSSIADWKAAEQMAWDNQAQFNAVKSALGLE